MKIHQSRFAGVLAYGRQVWMKIGFGKLWGDQALSLQAGAVLVAAMLLAVNAAARFKDRETPNVTLKVSGQLVDLAGVLHDELAIQADKIVRSCAYDSGDRAEEFWHDALAEPSSIRLVYAAPIKLRLPRRSILISEAVFSLKDTKFLGQPSLHYNGRTTSVAKCDGQEMLGLMCMPDLAMYFPPGYQVHCHSVRQ